jgi:hypothetical protein
VNHTLAISLARFGLEDVIKPMQKVAILNSRLFIQAPPQTARVAAEGLAPTPPAARS